MKRPAAVLCFVFTVCALASACRDGADTTSPPSALPPGHPPMGGSSMGGAPAGGISPHAVPGASPIAWTVPPGWTGSPPSSQMRLAEFTIDEGGAGRERVQCIIFGGIGGGTQANVDRWIGQFTQADGTATKDRAKVVRTERDGLVVTRVDVTGTFTAQMMPGVGDPKNAADWRQLGAIVEGPKGSVVVKLLGPAATVTAAEAKFDELLAGMRVGP